MGASPRLKCPACGAEVVRPPVTNVRARRFLTCTACGVPLQIVIPYGLYAIFTLCAVIAGSMLIPTIFMAWFEKKWMMLALDVALLFTIFFGTNVLLNRRTTVELAVKRP